MAQYLLVVLFLTRRLKKPMKIIFKYFKIFFVTLFFTFHVQTAIAGSIGFEELTSRNNFGSLGIANTYLGFNWGYSFSGDLGSAIWGNSQQGQGWASATQTQSVTGVNPGNINGQSYAWNWSGTQNLFIDFKSLYNVSSIEFAKISPTYPFNASSINVKAYDASGNLISQSLFNGLTDSFVTHNYNISGAQYLQIQANPGSQWFAIDNIQLNQQTNINNVPEPASIVLLALGLFGISASRRKNNQA